MGAPSVPPGRFSACTWWATRASTQSALEFPVAALRLVSGCRTIRLSRPARACPMKPRGGLRLGSGLDGEAGLVKGERIGVDASTMEANAALRNIVRRDTGGREMLEHLARESGIETPTAEDLALESARARSFPTRTGFRRATPSDRQDEGGTTHLAYKPEHAVDLTGRWWPPSCTRRRGRHDDASQNVGDGRGEPCER